jgi:hypothetical protein
MQSAVNDMKIVSKSCHDWISSFLDKSQAAMTSKLMNGQVPCS